MQSEARLPSVTLVDWVEDVQPETFLSAVDVWIIPYRKNVARVSVPYNLLAIGRPVILVSEAAAEPASSSPTAPPELTKTISRAAGVSDRSGPNARLKSQGSSISTPRWPAIAV